MRTLTVVVVLTSILAGCDGYTSSGWLDFEVDPDLSGDFNVSGRWSGTAASGLDGTQTDFTIEFIQRASDLSGGFTVRLNCFPAGSAGVPVTAVNFVDARFVSGYVFGFIETREGMAQGDVGFDLDSPPNQFSFDGTTLDNQSMTARYQLTNVDAACSNKGEVMLQKS